MSRASAAALLAAGLLTSVGMACARDGDARTLGPSQTSTPADTAALGRLLRAVRGVDPLLCELAVKSVDTHGWWSRWGPMRDNPLDVSAPAAALIAWIQDRHDDPAFVPPLRAALRDPDACVRRVAGGFLGRVDHPSAAEALVAALEDEQAGTRQVAAIGLGLGERVMATPALIRLLRDDSPAVRRAAAWALGSIESGAALQPLINALERDSDPLVRQAAAWALGRLDR